MKVTNSSKQYTKWNSIRWSELSNLNHSNKNNAKSNTVRKIFWKIIKKIFNELCEHIKNSNVCAVRVYKRRVSKIFKKIMANLFQIWWKVKEI